MPRLTSTALLLLMLAHQPAMAQTADQTPDIAQPVVSRLQTEGYAVTEVSRTWLGTAVPACRGTGGFADTLNCPMMFPTLSTSRTVSSGRSSGVMVATS